MRRTRKRLRHRPHALYPIGFRSFPYYPPIANDHESLYAVVRCVGFEVFDRSLEPLGVNALGLRRYPFSFLSRKDIRLDPDVSPSNAVRARAGLDAVNLQANEASCVLSVGFLFGQVFDQRAVDPRPNPRSLGYDSVVVPLAIAEVFVRDQPPLGRQPTEPRGFGIYVAGFGAILAAGFDFDLWSDDATLSPVGPLTNRTLPRLRTDLDA